MCNDSVAWKAGVEYQKWSEWPLQKLIQSYRQIEIDLLRSLTSHLLALLSEERFRVEGELLVRDDTVWRLSLGMIEKGRVLCASLRMLQDHGSAVLAESPVSHFGLIRRVVVQGEAPIGALTVERICDSLSSRVIGVYTALEAAFRNGHAELEDLVFRPLYGVLKTHLAVQGKEHLYGRIWFFIAEPKQGFFYFDADVLGRVIDHYKSNQQSDLSPFELTVWLMSEPLPFEKTLSIDSLRAEEPLSLEWAKARFIRDAPRVLLAEIFLYDSNEYTAYVCAHCRRFYLSITYPTSIAHQIKPELPVLSAMLEQQFKSCVSQWSPYVRVMRRIRTTGQDNRVASLIGTVVGSALREFMSNS